MLHLRGALAAVVAASSEKSRASKQLHSPHYLHKRGPSVSDTPDALVPLRPQKCEVYRTVTFEEAPAYQQDNPYIRTGYRVDFAYSTCLVSLFRCHNQTCNVWSHLLGVPVFLGLGLFTLVSIAPYAKDPETTFMFLLFLGCAIVSMLTSSIYHLFQCHSEDTWLRLLQIDLSGVSVIIAGSCYPSIWIVFGNGCHGSTAIGYISMIALVCSIGMVGPLWPPFNTPRYRRLRVVVYSGMGLLSLIPIVHMTFVFPAPVFLPVIANATIAFVIFGTGVWFYATKFPERKWPGHFDIWFHSHTNWHICCVLGSMQVFYTAYHCFTHRHLFAACLPPQAF